VPRNFVRSLVVTGSVAAAFPLATAHALALPELPVPVPAPPQVSVSVPSLTSPPAQLPPLQAPAVPVAAPSHPLSPTVPALPSTGAIPLASGPAATSTSGVTRASQVAGTPSTTPTAGTSAPAQNPAASRASRRREAVRSKKIRRAVRHFRGCLGTLPRRERRYLAMRAGLGRAHRMSRADAAARVGVSLQGSRRFERRSLAALRRAGRSGACGGVAVTVGPALSGLGAFVARSLGGQTAPAGTQPAPATALAGRRRVLGKKVSSRFASDNESTPPPASGNTPPGAVTRPAVTPDPASDDFSLLWLVAALAALAALAGASLVRGRLDKLLPARGSRGAAVFSTATLEREEGAAPAVVAPVPAPVPERDPEREEQDTIRRVFAALSAGDVDTAAELVHPDVSWPHWATRGTIHGRAEFADEWKRRLARVVVTAEPVEFARMDDGLIAQVNEEVRNRETGLRYGEYSVRRHFRFRDGLVAEMTVQPYTRRDT
jgi:ketosteroid isomerase-like protein